MLLYNGRLMGFSPPTQKQNAEHSDSYFWGGWPCALLSRSAVACVTMPLGCAVVLLHAAQSPYRSHFTLLQGQLFILVFPLDLRGFAIYAMLIPRIRRKR